jgi:signal transduction histidine kinase
MRSRIRDLLESRSRMLAAVSHDLRTPLTRLRLRAEALPEGEDKDRMLRDLGTMNGMISQSLSYLRDQATKGRMDRIDVSALLDTIADDFADTGHEVTFEGARNVVIVADHELLIRAISNVVDNAVKFGGAAEIGLTLPSPSQIAITVTDHGPGIPDPQKQAAFEPFSRGDAARHQGEDDAQGNGFGLGLAIARQIVERHGGAITLHDAEPEGLTVKISLPIFAGHATRISAVDQDSSAAVLEAQT